MKFAVLWGVTTCGSSMLPLLVTANIVPRSLTLVTLIMEATGSFETSVHTRATRRNILEDCILVNLFSILGDKRLTLEIGLNVVDWIGLTQDRYRWRALVSSVMNLRVP
jgi:hypothetical protein